MDPWMSWTGFGVVLVAGTLYYSDTAKELVGIGHKPVDRSQNQPLVAQRRQDKQPSRRKDRNEKQEQADPASYAEAAAISTSVGSGSNTKKRKPSKASAPVAKAAVPAASSARETVQEEEEEEEEEVDDKQWALELGARRKGVSLDKAASAGGSSRGQKKSKALPQEAKTDEAPKVSSSQTRNAGDVSDMLPAPSAGPSTIRITGEEKAKKQHAPKAEPAKETKKQRQNKRKVEEQRLQREEDEKRRQAQLEQQRKSAREARGEPARNGVPAPKPTITVWSSSATAGSAPGSSGPATQPILANNQTQLLDTFDQDAASITSSNEPNTSATTPATVASTSGQDLPSEEAQLEALTGDSDWNEVSSKKKKSKAKVPAVVTPREQSPKRGNGYASVAASEPVRPRASAPLLPPVAKTNGYAVLQASGHPDDSDWAA